MTIKTKRVYEDPNRSDGCRILVDRLWPRGLSKAVAKIDLWVKQVAPSHDLRQWYRHDHEKWPEFKRRYFKELEANPKGIKELLDFMATGTITFVYSSKELRFNNAAALREFLESRR